MTNYYQLLLPAIRWDARAGFAGERELVDLALDRGVGGFIIFGGTTEALKELTTELRMRSRIPLLIGADLERGAGQQFAGATGLPPYAAIASLRDPAAIRGAAALTAVEARDLGVNWIYAPVCDLDVEPDNPIVGTRAAGSDPDRVADAATAWIAACQDKGVLACAKHFPGHGRTTADSHAELARVDVDEATLRETDLVPFEASIEAGVASVMSAHVAFPALDPQGGPATLSRRILSGLLREELSFNGLIVTDALIMEGVLGGGEREAVVRALAAGCDLLLYPTDIAGCAEAIEAAVHSGTLDATAIDASLERRRSWASWAHGERLTPPVNATDLRWAETLCESVVHWLHDELPPVRGDVDVIVIDDDLGGPYPAPSRRPFVDELRRCGCDPHERSEVPSEGKSFVLIALFGDIRSWKGRPGYSAKSLEAVRAAVAQVEDADARSAIVQFSHPRLAGALPRNVPILCAWGGEAVMQRAAARVLSGCRGEHSNEAEGQS